MATDSSALGTRRGVVADPYALGGDPDAAVAAHRRGLALYRNNGDGSYTPVPLWDQAISDAENKAYIRQSGERRARARLDSEGWDPPGPGRTLAEARLEPPDPPRQAVAEVVPYGFTIMAAQFKAGKTTVAMNLADSLGSGADFLGAYPVDFPAGNVGYWNLEVDEPQFYEWLDRLVKDETAAERIIVQHLRGKYVNFLHPPHAEWTIRWLRDNDVRAWIIDPLGRMLRNENDNAEFNEWFRAAEHIVREAGVDVVFIPHHTGHPARGEGDAVPRGRGASAQLGGTDCNLSYRHGGDLGGYPPDSRRYLSGFGRGVDLREITLDWDATGRLYAVADAPGRVADKEERLAENAVEALMLSGAERLNSTELQAAIGGDGGNRPKAIRAALRKGFITREQEGRNAWYSLAPETEKMRVSGTR